MPADDTQTTCAQCGMTVSSALRFCPHCGKPLVRKPGCPACGADLVPGIRFCRECGKKIESPAESSGSPQVTVTGPAQGAGMPVTPLPQTGSPAQAKVSGGSTLVKIVLVAGAALVLVFVLLVVIGLFLPDSPSEESGAAPGSMAPADIRPSAQEVTAREKARTDVIAALRQGNDEEVIGLMAGDDRAKYGSGLGLNAAGMATLATAISSAEVTEETPLSALYETRIGSSRYSFMAIKEDGAWKLAGI